MVIKSLDGYKTSVLASLGDEEAKQQVMRETPGFNMLETRATEPEQNQPVAQKTNLMTDEEKQKYIDGLTQAQYLQMRSYKNQGYSFEVSKALLENSKNRSSNNTESNWFRNMVGGAGDSATGIGQFLGNSAADIIGWTAKKLGADDERVDYLVNDFKNYLEDSKISNSVGADTDSFLYKGTKFATDLAQVAAGNAWLKGGLEAKLGGPLVTKETPLLAKMAVGAAEGATDMGLYSIVSDSELPSGKDLALGAGLGVVSPMLGAVGKGILNSTKKGTVKMAEDIIGSMNKMTLTQKNNFIKNFGEKATKWMNDRGIKTGEDLINYFKTSIGLVDAELAKIGGNFKSQEVTNILEGINSNSLEFEGIVKHAAKVRNPQATRLAELAEKNRNEGLTMSEINEVKRYFESMFGNKYKPAIWNQQGNSDKHQLMKNLDNELRERQRGTAEQMGFTDLAKLNKETQAARELMNNIKYGDAVGGTITLDDWLFLAQSIERGELGTFVAKKVIESNRFKKRAVDVLNKLGRHQNIDNRVMDAIGLSKVTNEKELNKWFNINRDDMGDVAQDMAIAGVEEISD